MTSTSKICSAICSAAQETPQGEGNEALDLLAQEEAKVIDMDKVVKEATNVWNSGIVFWMRSTRLPARAQFQWWTSPARGAARSPANHEDRPSTPSMAWCAPSHSLHRGWGFSRLQTFRPIPEIQGRFPFAWNCTHSVGMFVRILKEPQNA